MTIRLTMLAVVMALLTACASTEPGDQPKKEKPDYVKMAQNMGYAGLKRITRITNYRTQSWRYINDKAIIVNTSSDDAYLVTFNVPCIGLSSGHSLVAQKKGPSLTHSDQFVVRTYGSMTSSGRSTRCIIDNLYELE